MASSALTRDPAPSTTTGPAVNLHSDVQQSRRATERRRRRSAGQEVVEFGLVIFPLFGILFLTLDIAWAVFVRATIQEAVREGCRYAVTSQTGKDKSGKALGHADSIKAAVQRNALGLLGSKTDDAGWAKIQVNFYDPANLSKPKPVPTSSSDEPINQYPNIVEVVVTNFDLPPLTGPFFRAGNGRMTLNAASADRMEGAPSTGVPAY